jgi:hypothetical protein
MMTFRLLEQIGISDGATVRRISLYHGEIAEMTSADHADILVVSAFPDDYAPTPTSLIGALEKAGISVEQLSKKKLHDLRPTTGFWISHPMEPGGNVGIGQIACFEPQVRGSPPSVVGDLFRGLFPFLDDRKNQVVAMPVLASGDAGWPAETMLVSILEAASHWLARGLGIHELKIIVRDLEQAEALSATMSKFKAQMSVPAFRPAESISFDIFLSFSMHDASVADFVKSELHKADQAKRIFDSRSEIDRGTSWQREIDRAISSASRVVAVLSPSYFASPECQEELMQARLRNKRSSTPVLLPIYWRDIRRDLDLWLQATNYADCRESNFSKLSSVVNGLGLPTPNLPIL